MIHPLRHICLFTVITVFAACGNDPLSYSAPVGINLKAKSADTAAGVVANEKGINTESGNPYGAFINDARGRLGGRNPTVIDIDKVNLFLGSGSTGVTQLGQVFTGAVEVLFVMNDTNNSYPAAGANLPATTSSGPIPLTVSFPAESIPAIDYNKLLAGSFKVAIRGPAAAQFTTKGADADLQVTFTFAAFE
jgi:hypothetical protein